MSANPYKIFILGGMGAGYDLYLVTYCLKRVAVWNRYYRRAINTSWDEFPKLYGKKSGRWQ